MRKTYPADKSCMHSKFPLGSQAEASLHSLQAVSQGIPRTAIDYPGN